MLKMYIQDDAGTVIDMLTARCERNGQPAWRASIGVKLPGQARVVQSYWHDEIETVQRFILSARNYQFPSQILVAPVLDTLIETGSDAERAAAEILAAALDTVRVVIE